MSAALAYQINDCLNLRALNDNTPLPVTTIIKMTRGVEYDARGNITKIGNLAADPLTFIYDMADQPRSVSGTNRTGGPVSGGTYVYDSNLKRVKSVINGVTRYNVYDNQGRLAHVDEGADLATSIQTDYLHAAGMTLARIKDNVFTYMHPDHLGSSSAGTDAAGAVTFTEYHTPFGEALAGVAANDNQSDFTGHIRDKDIGMNYMQARYFDPNLGRFLSVDPVTMLDMDMNPEYFNRYSYTTNDPINAIDPNGESTISAGGSITFSKPKFIGDPNITVIKVGLKVSVSLPVPFLDPTAEFDTGVSATIGGGDGADIGLKDSLDGSSGPGSVKDLAGRTQEGGVHIVAAGGAVSFDKETGELSEVTASIGPGVSVAATENQTFTLSLRNGFLSD